MQSYRISIAALALGTLWIAPVSAQTFRCANPDANARGVCTINAPKSENTVTVEFTLLAPVGARINVKLDKGNGSVTAVTTPVVGGEPNTTVAPAGGLVRYAWTGFIGDAPQELTARASINNSESILPIRIAGVMPPSTVAVQFPNQILYGYAERQLKHPVVAVINAPPELCSRTLIAFRAGDGTVSPDTVRGASPEGRAGCVASTWWRLGKGTGRQTLRASVVGSSNFETATAVARAAPHIFAGVAVTYDFHNYRIVKRDSTIQHVTIKHGADTTVVSDTVIRKDRVHSQSEGWNFAPTVGADFPLGRRRERLRGSLAVSLTEPTRDFYFGLSIIQPFAGVSYENLGIDVHLVGHLGRRDVTRQSACPNNDAAQCEMDEKLLFLGLGAMATVEPASLLSTITTIFK